MKKFSNITNQKVGEEKIEKVDKSEDILKVKIISLIDNFLRIQSYGPVDNRFLSGSVKIEGKEVLAEAIIDLFEDTSNEDTKKVLESLKSKIKDWREIDSKIDSISENKVDISNKLKMGKLLERYDGDSLLLFIEGSVDKINNKKTLLDYCKIIKESNLNDDLKQKTIKLYKDRIEKI